MKTPEEWQKKVRSDFEPSSYQCDIFQWIAKGSGNAVVEAVAGSGKSTTIVLGARLILGFGVYIAFSKPIVEEIKPKLSGTNMEPRTVHSIGYGAIRSNNRGTNIRVEGNGSYKYRDRIKMLEAKIDKTETLLNRGLSKDELKALRGKGKKARLPAAIILDLFSKARLNLVDFESKHYPNILWEIANHHNTEIPEVLDVIISDVIKHLASWGKTNISIIDFTDMIWLPIVCNWTPKKWMWVFVDECQDISPAQLALIKKCIRNGGRSLWVGDRCQAIFGFAGADAKSFQQIIVEMKAKIIPLSVCYRCPTSGIKIAKKWVPQMEAAPGAKEGSVSKIDFEAMLDSIQKNDMILSRKNAPLVGTAFALISKGKPAIVKGKAIGEGLVKVVEKIARKSLFSEFGEEISKWVVQEKESLEKRGGDKASIQQKSIMLDDTAECIRIVLQRKETTSVQTLIGSISNLFSDTNGSITLSSIHRAKGLENDRIFILGPTEIYFKGQRPWQRKQENNLSYVAHTRHKQDLFLVKEKTKEKNV